MIYVNLRSVILSATVTNKRSHVGQGSADDLIKQYESGEISRMAFVSKVSYRHKKRICPLCSLYAARVPNRAVSAISPAHTEL
jgi:predicted GNAT family acetyltransferase